jgi:hypothetical protein
VLLRLDFGVLDLRRLLCSLLLSELHFLLCPKVSQCFMVSSVNLYVFRYILCGCRVASMLVVHLIDPIKVIGCSARAALITRRSIAGRYFFFSFAS